MHGSLTSNKAAMKNEGIIEGIEESKELSPLAKLSKDIPPMEDSQLSASFSKVTYTPEEIASFRAKVERLEYTVSVKKSNVHNWECKVSLSDTKEGRANGNYAYNCSKLSEAKSELRNAEAELREAKARLNNAL